MTKRTRMKARAKKTSRRVVTTLGESIDAHVEAMRSAERTAMESAEESWNDAKGGNCRRADILLREAERAFGQAMAHRDSIPMRAGDLDPNTRAAMSHARMEFQSNCLCKIRRRRK